MNKLTIIGNLTKEPELRSTQDGTSVCGFTVAVNRPKSRTNPDPGADFFNVNAWRVIGENCARFLSKGNKVAVTGRVGLRTWEKDGKHGASLEVTADDVEFLSSRTGTVTPAETAHERQGGFVAVEPDDFPL